MTNLEDYQDVETHRSFATLKKVFGAKNAIKKMAYCSRDNARVPMQWDATQNAGFSTGKPWLKVNPNHTTINVANAEADGNSVLHYYRKLIALRKSDKAFVYGTYQDLLPNSKNVWAYMRNSQFGTLVVVANFSTKTTKFALPKHVQGDFQLVTSNYADTPQNLQNMALRPHECSVYKLM